MIRRFLGPLTAIVALLSVIGCISAMNSQHTPERWCVEVHWMEPEGQVSTPVPQAWVAVFAADGGEGVEHGAGLGSTDGRGRLAVDLSGTAPFVARIDVPGFARTFVPVEAGHEREEHAKRVVVERPASASLHLAPIPSVDMENDDQLIAVVRTAADSRFPGFEASRWISEYEYDLLDAFHDGEDEPDDLPFAEVYGLPANVPVELELLLGDQRVHRQTLLLEPGHQDLRVQLEFRHRIRGTVRRRDGSPLAHYPIGLSFRGLSEIEYPHCEPVFTARTDAEGRYELPVFPGEWWAGASCFPCVLSDLDPDSSLFGHQERWPMDLGRWVVIAEEDAVVELDFEADSGRPIRGKVTRNGGGAIGAQLTAYNDRVQHSLPFLGTLGMVKSGLGGHFALTPIPPGTHRIRAARRGEISQLAVAEDGTEDVQLELHPVPRVRGRTVDGRTGEPCSAVVRVLAPPFPDAQRSDRRDGSFDLPVWPGTVEVLCTNEELGLVQYVGDLEIGEEGVVELEIALEPAARLHVEDCGVERHWSVSVAGGTFEPITTALQGDGPLVTKLHKFLVPTGEATLRASRAYWESDFDDRWTLSLPAGEKTVVQFLGR